jgi:hypothetical protein
MSSPFDPTPCPACGLPIWIGQTEEGERIPLEPQPEFGGLHRYMLHPDPVPGHGPGVPDRVQPVIPEADIQAYADHRQECPNFNEEILRG